MKKTLKLPVIVLLALTLLHISCRQEETQFVEAPKEESLKVNSTVANLLRRTAMKDGSEDNIIDNSSCFTIELPVTLEVNDLEIIIDSKEDFKTIEEIFDEFDDDDDKLIIKFPITIILQDFTQVSINSFEEFEDFSNDCTGENEYDDDIECADIKYPITATVFNQSNEVVDTITINTDKELYDFIEDLDENDIVNVSFPIVVILADGSEVETNSLDELESILDNAKDDCDEDDDNDYNDDDCENCTPNLLSDILVGCANWSVDKLERGNEDHTDQYAGYQFNFMADGSLSATLGNGVFPGTWESNGSGNNMSVVINIPNHDYFNAPGGCMK